MLRRAEPKRRLKTAKRISRFAEINISYFNANKYDGNRKTVNCIKGNRPLNNASSSRTQHGHRKINDTHTDTVFDWKTGSTSLPMEHNQPTDLKHFQEEEGRKKKNKNQSRGWSSETNPTQLYTSKSIDYLSKRSSVKHGAVSESSRRFCPVGTRRTKTRRRRRGIIKEK